MFNVFIGQNRNYTAQNCLYDLSLNCIRYYVPEIHFTVV